MPSQDDELVIRLVVAACYLTTCLFVQCSDQHVTSISEHNNAVNTRLCTFKNSQQQVGFSLLTAIPPHPTRLLPYCFPHLHLEKPAIVASIQFAKHSSDRDRAVQPVTVLSPTSSTPSLRSPPPTARRSSSMANPSSTRERERERSSSSSSRHNRTIRCVHVEWI